VTIPEAVIIQFVFLKMRKVLLETHTHTHTHTEHVCLIGLATDLPLEFCLLFLLKYAG